MKLIINANREGYGTDQVTRTMTVGELIDLLSQYDAEMPVYVGNDRQYDGYWYTYGGITEYDFHEEEEEEEEEDDDE